MRLFRWLLGEATTKQLTDDERACIDRLIERMDRLEKSDRVREVEWTSWYDKFRSLYSRIAKRAERAEEAGNGAPDAPESTKPIPGYGHAPLPTFRTRRGF